MTLSLVPDLCRLAVAVVLHDVDTLSAFGADHADEGDSIALRETLLQSHLFCGFPRTIAALDLLRSVGLELSAPTGAPLRLPRGAERARGEELFDLIYGSGADGVRAHLESLDPAFAGWVAEHAYGRVLSRPALAGSARELLAAAMLAATGHDRQLASHVRGAVRCGARRDEIDGVLDAIEDLVSTENMARARQVASRFARPE